MERRSVGPYAEPRGGFSLYGAPSGRDV